MTDLGERGAWDRGDAQAVPATGRADDECLRCGRTIESLGVYEFRTGGSTGAAHLLLGQWAELGEDKVRMEILSCRACRHLEFRAPG
jgi:hypothetical protein